MKKVFYLLLGGVIMLSGNLIGQSSKSQYTVKKSVDVKSAPTKTKIDASAKGEAIFFDSFANFDNWDVSDESIPNSWGWTHETDASIIPVAALSPMMSTTVDDGFAFVEGDSQGEGSIQNANLTMAEPVDLSNWPFVSVNFEQNTRNYQTTYTLRVSPDNGTTWFDVLVNEGLDTNTNTDNPESTSINVSELIGGASEALVEFNFQADWGWHWAIDDFSIAEAPEFDLAFVGAYYDEYIEYLELDEFLDTDYIQEVEHSNYRENQVRPLSFIGEVRNQGVGTVTDVVLSVEITTPAGTENFSSDPIDVEPGLQTYIKIEDVMLDAWSDNSGEIGDYSVTYSITMTEDDAIPENNIPLDRTFAVNADYMATDLGQDWSTYYPTLGEDVIWASRCMFEQEMDINYISFGVLQTDAAPSQPGDLIFLNMRSGSVLELVSDENVMNRYFGDEELEYTLSEGDFTTAEEVVWINYVLPEPITVSPGVVYQGEVEIPAVGDDYLWIPFSNQQSSFVGVLYEYADESGGAQGWWTLGGNAPHIRLGFNSSVGVDDRADLNFKLGQNYPNPSTGSTRIDWELLEPADNVQFRISDINGRTVYQEDLGNRPSGIQESLELNLNLAAGNYQYALQIGNEIIVRKMVITK